MLDTNRIPADRHAKRERERERKGYSRKMHFYYDLVKPPKHRGKSRCTFRLLISYLLLE
jgi:hypothetical protein